MEIKYVYESFWASLLNDSVTFSFFLGSCWFNYEFIGGSYFVNGVILVMFMIFVVGKSHIGRVYSKELVNDLKAQKPEQTGE